MKSHGVNRDSRDSRPKIGELNGKTGEKRRSKHFGVLGTGDQVIAVYDQLIGFEGSLIGVYEPVMRNLIPSKELGFGHSVCLVSCR